MLTRKLKIPGRRDLSTIRLGRQIIEDGFSTVYGRIESSKCAFFADFDEDAAIFNEVNFPSPHPFVGEGKDSS